MKAPTRSLIHFIVAAVFCGASAVALAMPKAAEDESTQVSSGVDAARPKHSLAKPAPVVAKPRSAPKHAKSVKTTKPAKSMSSAKKTKPTKSKK